MVNTNENKYFHLDETKSEVYRSKSSNKLYIKSHTNECMTNSQTSKYCRSSHLLYIWNQFMGKFVIQKREKKRENITHKLYF